jgi:neutral ceramidase
MSQLHVGMASFDFTPRIHPTCGAWGTTAAKTEIDMPLLGRCVALAHGDTKILWYGLDLVGENPEPTDVHRDDVAAAVGLSRDQIIWSTSQTHSSGALPGSQRTGNSITDLTEQDAAFATAEQARFVKAYIDAGREALDRLQPATVWAGRGYCDSISYNSRLPMPTGGCKFSRHHDEGLQAGKFYDTTVGLIRFEDRDGKPIGVIFNFCCHPAVLINDQYVSSDYPGTARQYIEDAVGAPAMFVQGFCGDVHCHHMFGTPWHAKRLGTRLGKAAVGALPTLVPVRGTPLAVAHRNAELPCVPMPGKAQVEADIASRQAYIEELANDPTATWFDGTNAPDSFNREQNTRFVQVKLKYLHEALRMLEAGETPASSLSVAMGAVRIGDVAALLSVGENFTLTGRSIRERSPFAHTLICGDTNGLFGYIGDDTEMDRRGYETHSYWQMLYPAGFRLAPAKGATARIISTAADLLSQLRSMQS